MLIFSYSIKIFLMVHSYVQPCNICGNKKRNEEESLFFFCGCFKDNVDQTRACLSCFVGLTLVLVMSQSWS